MRPSSALQTVTVFSSLPKTFTSLNGQPHSPYLQLRRPKRCSLLITMRDRSKNPRPLQKGRNLSTEAIQTIQALKRAQKNEGVLEQVFNSKFRRLLKLDMMAVLKDLLRQNECFLALKVFEDIRKEYWYKPPVLLYADMIKGLQTPSPTEILEKLKQSFVKETEQNNRNRPLIELNMRMLKAWLRCPKVSADGCQQKCS